VFEFRLFADYDGVVDPADEESFEKALASALADEKKAEEQVYMEGRALLCPGCREDLLEALGAAEHAVKGENGKPPGEGGPDTVH
jgi:hypothetical protein